MKSIVKTLFLGGALAFASLSIHAQQQNAVELALPAIMLQNLDSTGNPQLLFDEDFTDSSFNGYGAVDGTRNNWSPFGGSVRFRRPNNRPFTLGFSRRPNDGGAAWEGLQWTRSLNGAAPRPGANTNLYEYLVDKYEDVCVLRFESYGDIAANPPVYGIEVAMLEEDNNLCGPPHFCHDLSFEAMQHFAHRSGNGALQLEANVENSPFVQNSGTQQIHWTVNNGFPNDSVFGESFRNEVIWRPRPGSGNTNVEQWGNNTRVVGDYNISAEMNNMKNPNERYAKFSLVQVALFRSGLPSGNRYTLRGGVTAADAQIGIKNCYVALTKRSDFNLDLKVDSLDEDIFISQFGRVGPGTTIKTGDASNDGRVDINDANSLVAFMPLRKGVDSVKVSLKYDPSTGEIRLTAKNLPYLKLEGGGRLLRPNNLSTAAIGQPTAITTSDTAIGFYFKDGLTVNDVSLGTIAVPSLIGGQLRAIMNYKGSNAVNGFVLPIGGPGIALNSKGQLIRPKLNLELEGNTFAIADLNTEVKASIMTLDGRLLHQQTYSQVRELSQHLKTLHFGGQLKLIRVETTVGQPQVLLNQRYLTLH